MSRYWKQALVSGSFFGFWMGVSELIFSHVNLIQAIGAALVCGLLFGLSMAWISRSAPLKQAAIPPLELAAHIQHSSPANHFRGPIAMGGVLFLTAEQLFFQAHALLQPPYTLTIAVNTIVRCSPWWFPTIIRVQTTAGKTAYFTVLQRQQWIAAIHAACQAAIAKQ